MPVTPDTRRLDLTVFAVVCDQPKPGVKESEILAGRPIIRTLIEKVDLLRRRDLTVRLLDRANSANGLVDPVVTHIRNPASFGKSHETRESLWPGRNSPV